mmetsp:Transcript_97735/g.237697  ORF Transcript_97735/g.237697 Transcript_97735/m.237697 type:complete len:272 (+) Transcript_97735:208-1023(+)
MPSSSWTPCSSPRASPCSCRQSSHGSTRISSSCTRCARRCRGTPKPSASSTATSTTTSTTTRAATPTAAARASSGSRRRLPRPAPSSSGRSRWPRRPGCARSSRRPGPEPLRAWPGAPRRPAPSTAACRRRRTPSARWPGSARRRWATCAWAASARACRGRRTPRGTPRCRPWTWTWAGARGARAWRGTRGASSAPSDRIRTLVGHGLRARWRQWAEQLFLCQGVKQTERRQHLEESRRAGPCLVADNRCSKWHGLLVQDFPWPGCPDWIS